MDQKDKRIAALERILFVVKGYVITSQPKSLLRKHVELKELTLLMIDDAINSGSSGKLAFDQPKAEEQSATVEASQESR